MLSASADSSAPTDLLWARASDVTAWPDHLETFTSVRHLGGPSPTAVGSHYEVRQPGLPTTVYEVTEWRPARSFTWVSRAPGVTGSAKHSVTATAGGSRLELELAWTGPLAWVVRLLLARKAQGMIELEASTFAELAATDAARG